MSNVALNAVLLAAGLALARLHVMLRFRWLRHRRRARVLPGVGHGGYATAVLWLAGLATFFMLEGAPRPTDLAGGVQVVLAGVSLGFAIVALWTWREARRCGYLDDHP